MNGLKELAEQAGMHYRRIEDEFCKANTDGVPMEMLEAFAKLVAAKEREACAKSLENNAEATSNFQAKVLIEWCATQIRARGEA